MGGKNRLKKEGFTKVRKSPPFDTSFITDQYPFFSHLLANAVSQLDELPDFSEDDKIAITSDFGGEHAEASFYTYSFLIFSYNKIEPFIERVNAIRHKYQILEPFSEFEYKDLRFGPRSRALPDFLLAIDDFIHGVLVTVAIDKKIGTVFGPSKKLVHPFIEQQFKDLGLGSWKGEVGEKALRICHSIAMFVALTTYANQRLLWYCDSDSINDDGIGRSFQDTQKLFSAALGMYCKHEFDLIGFGKSFDKKSHLDDLLSVTDFAAGVIQDVLKSHHSIQDGISGFERKEVLIKWLAKKSKFLSKATIQITTLPNGDIGSGLVSFTPVTPKL